MTAEHLEDKCVLLVEVQYSKEVPDADAAAAESAAAAELEVVVRRLKRQAKVRQREISAEKVNAQSVKSITGGAEGSDGGGG